VADDALPSGQLPQKFLDGMLPLDRLATHWAVRHRIATIPAAHVVVAW